MIRALAISVIVAAGCVPASSPLPPAGAGGFRTDPSAASRGEPFVTDDGWTVRVETLAISAFVVARPLADHFGGSGAMFVWNGSVPTELYAPGLPTGDARMTLWLEERYLPDDFRGPPHEVGLTEDVAARFRREGDDAPLAPAMVIVLRAERGGRNVTLDLALTPGLDQASSSATEDGPLVNVKADSLATVPLPIRAEALLIDANANAAVTAFSPFAAADERGNGDGVVSAAELRAVRIPCTAFYCKSADAATSPDGVQTTLLQALRDRLPSVVAVH